MTPTTERAGVTVRRVTPSDSDEIVREIVTVLTAALVDGPVARWVVPEPEARYGLTRTFLADTVADTLQRGSVHVARSDALDGGVDGVALWFPRLDPPSDPGPVDPLGSGDAAAEDPGDLVAVRWAVLDGLLASRHPRQAHHHLAYLGVRPERQGRGIGGVLLDHHHALLDAAGIPAYLEANHPRNRALYLRHGYASAAAIRLPDATPLWPMWRRPGPPP